MEGVEEKDGHVVGVAVVSGGGGMRAAVVGTNSSSSSSNHASSSSSICLGSRLYLVSTTMLPVTLGE